MVTDPPPPATNFRTPDGTTYQIRLDINTARRLRAADPALDILGPASIRSILDDELLTLDALRAILQPTAADFEDQLTAADQTGDTFTAAVVALCQAFALFFRSLGRRDQAARLAELAAELAAAGRPPDPPPPGGTLCTPGWVKRDSTPGHTA